MERDPETVADEIRVANVSLPGGWDKGVTLLLGPGGMWGLWSLGRGWGRLEVERGISCEWARRSRR